MKQYKKDIILEAPGASMASLTSISNTNAPPVTSSFSEHDIIYAGPVTADSTSNYTEPTELSKSAGGTEAVMGEWKPVTPPPAPPINNTLETDEPNNVSISQEASFQDDEEEEEDPDDLRNFKVVEKTFPLDDQIPEDYTKDKDSSKVTFKKRKFAGQAKTRNIRKKK